jgi:hypothetical protein
MRLFTQVLALVVLLSANPVARAETIDERFKKLGENKLEVGDHTRDACDRANVVTITSTTDGDIQLRPGETKYFEIDKKKDGYTQSGGWYWKCGNSEEKARIRGATYIKAVRKENGVIDWYSVTLKAK